MMKKKHIYIYLLGMLLLSIGCTGKFREFNQPVGNYGR